MIPRVLAENSLFHSIGQIFQPIFKIFATILAFIYSVIPNYAVSIALLTVLIMLALTPLTVKSTKSMLAMQRLQPEVKKLQQKYKGPENREQLNQELMALYKEQGVNPASSCLPAFLQMPFLFILYDIIKGLTNTVASGAALATGGKCIPPHGYSVCAEPRYIPTSSTMYHNLVAHPGEMVSFGINLALKPFSHHPSVWAAIPYYLLVAVACALQFVQMWQMNRRNPGAAKANPQMRNMQYFMPIIFAFIYLNIQAAVVIYMIVSTLIRIATQDIMFRTGITAPPAAERAIGAATEAPKGTATSPKKPAVAKGTAALEAGTAAPEGKATNGSAAAKGKSNGTNGSPATGNGRSGQKKAPAPAPDPAANGDEAAKQHPRSKSKRARKAR